MRGPTNAHPAPSCTCFFSPEQLHEVADERYQRCRERFDDDGITG
ncbi:hypothetical protein SD15574_5486 [Shigella dysenteriae 155-74]|nr:hypothetical protein SD15574_5486 [Shigella dysenteriae 155-74]